MCIKLHFYLVILLVYFYAIHKIKLFLVFYLFAFLHELMHILTALVLDINVKEICLLPVGICAKYDYIECKAKEILIAASGPLFSILIACISNNLFLKNINLSIAFLNLIPIYPLDGGRIIRGLMEIIFGYKRSIILSNKIAQLLFIVLGGLGIIFAVYFKNFSMLFLDIYIYILIKEELKKERIIKIVNSFVADES